jgi:hypothetical protein
MQSSPDLGFLPIAQSTPAGRAAAAAKFLGQQPPGGSPCAGRR